MKRLEIHGCTERELIDLCQELGLKRFRGTQLFQWVQQKGAADWDELKNIGQTDKELLKERLELVKIPILREQQSKDGTRKFLLGLADGEGIECVLMDYDRKQSRDRHTVCLSTQVGCAVGCTFCATGLGGFRRNLTAGEIVGQVLGITRKMREIEPGFQVTNLVFMGMGEPLLNYDEVLKTIEILNSEHGQNIGMRRMTISTSGVAPKIRQLAKDNPQVGLAVSLHAANDEWRNELIPMNRRY
nr:23S rRNA (adenine(2503)-C(2))-methyltransferase RlmN [Desulfitobacterium hafniense]